MEKNNKNSKVRLNTAFRFNECEEVKDIKGDFVVKCNKNDGLNSWYTLIELGGSSNCQGNNVFCPNNNTYWNQVKVCAECCDEIIREVIVQNNQQLMVEYICIIPEFFKIKSDILETHCKNNNINKIKANYEKQINEFEGSHESNESSIKKLIEALVSLLKMLLEIFLKTLENQEKNKAVENSIKRR